MEFVTVLWIGAITSGIAIFLVRLVIFRLLVGAQQRRVGRSTGTVVEVERLIHTKQDEGLEEVRHHPVFEFTVGRETLRVRSALGQTYEPSSRHRVGDPVVVRFNPESPSDAEIEDQYISEQIAFLLNYMKIISVFLIALGAIGLSVGR